MEEIVTPDFDETVRNDLPSQLVAGVASPVVVEGIVSRPQPAKCRYRHQDHATRFEELAGSSENRCGIFQMLQDVGAE